MWLPANDTIVGKFQYDYSSYYSGMVPKLRFNGAMIAIWSLLLIAQIIQLYWRQWWFSVAFICASILEVLGYIGRTKSHFDVYNIDMFLLQIICLTIAPVFTMGGVYYQLAKLIEVYGHRFSLLPSPMAYSYIFIFSDIVSLAIQAAGGGTSGVAVRNYESTRKGDHIFEAGLGIQVGSMAIFLGFWLHFLYSIYIKVRLEYTGEKRFKWSMWKISQAELDTHYRAKYSDLRLNHKPTFLFHYFNLAITAVVLLVLTRCCYRLAELHEGWRGYLITHEWYFIILDSLMITLATLILTVFHPGFVFNGRNTSIPITHGRVDPETLENHSLEANSDAEMSSEKVSDDQLENSSEEHSDEAAKAPFYKSKPKIPKMKMNSIKISNPFK
ncbi:phospholipid-translocating ATPase RSB1 [Nakaseomyces bracarensis]|uniref:phospholipid-translocating ATPase RSB1 n=1 Tax=Nakaseomyces bracarensis TaxID=273131 RepID=UPI00387104C7